MMITDFDEILDILETSKTAFLYDTAAISLHELFFHRDGIKVMADFSNDHPMIITKTVYKELKMDTNNERYSVFLEQFKHVLLVPEETFVDYFHETYSTKKRALAKYKESSIIAFKNIQKLTQTIDRLGLDNLSYKINECYDSFFASGKNKGEYSLLWLSTVLFEVCPTLNITFVGIDRDLYKIVDHCYFRFADIHPELKSNKVVRILSNDLLLQALVRQQKPIHTLCEKCRDETRKVLYKEIRDGITNYTMIEGSMNNQEFEEGIRQSKFEIIY